MRKFTSLFILCLVMSGVIEVQAFTLQIVADNDFAVFTGNSSGINNDIYQSTGTWNTQVAKRASLELDMPPGDTEFYILGMGGGGQENISGTVNGIDMVTLAGSSGKVMMSNNISSFLSSYNSAAVESGTYIALLGDVKNAYTNLTWSDAISAKNNTHTVIVESKPPSGWGFAIGELNAVLFKFAAADVNVDYGHKFVGTTTTMDVYKNATATDIRSLLHFSDTESAQTITWSQSVAPDQGGTLSFTNATASSGSTDITPGGTITYTPKSGYVGTEYFTVQATDGTYRNTRRITVTVLPLQYAVTSSVGPHGSISPPSPVTVIEGQTTSFTIKPDVGYNVDTPIVSTCGGFYTGNTTDSINGITFTTSAVNADCSVAATFSYISSLPDTGQIKCYQAVDPFSEIPCTGTGQDGAYSTNPMSYTDNSNGTITDNNTGLVWQKCSIGQNNDAGCSGTSSGSNWYQASGTYHADYNATTQNICGTLSLAGGGWRLPSKKELYGIVDFSVPSTGPTIVQTVFPNTPSSSIYWTSTTVALNAGWAWYVYFDGSSPSIAFALKEESSSPLYVRCVR